MLRQTRCTLVTGVQTCALPILFPEASRILGPWIIVLGVIGILYGALLAMGQRDLKRLVSYTSIAHFGFIGLGVFAFTSQAQTGAVLYMVNHGHFGRASSRERVSPSV